MIMEMTTNTTNAIANASNARRTVSSPATMMKNIVQNEQTMRILKDSLKENAGAFAASVIELYSTDKLLQKCDPKAVWSECLKAVSLKLPIVKDLGLAYVIPYNNKPTFQIGYKGLLQLAMRTGAYRYLNAGAVYEGELVSTDKLSGKVDLSGTRTGDNVIGYFAYMETLNGFTKTLYWSREQSIEHAKKYSKSYASGNQIWREHPDEMFTKQVLRNLLSHWGVLSVEMVKAFSAESEENTVLADEKISSQTGAIETIDYEVSDNDG